MAPDTDTTCACHNVVVIGTVTISTAINSNVGTVTERIPMGWGSRELTPEEKVEKAEKLRLEQLKATKRAVLRPKAARWA
jgi:hypothetical protein